LFGNDENIDAQTCVRTVADVAAITLKSCHCTVTDKIIMCDTEPEVAVTTIDAVSPVGCRIGLPEPQPPVPASPRATPASTMNPKLTLVD
jgi:hypothetical protein